MSKVGFVEFGGCTRNSVGRGKDDFDRTYFNYNLTKWINVNTIFPLMIKNLIREFD